MSQSWYVSICSGVELPQTVKPEPLVLVGSAANTEATVKRLKANNMAKILIFVFEFICDLFPLLYHK
jgi:hypothetical protein